MREQVRAAWAVALGISDFTDDANFFELGGDSAAVLSVAMALEEELGVFVETDIIYASPIFSDFLTSIEAFIG